MIWLRAREKQSDQRGRESERESKRERELFHFDLMDLTLIQRDRLMTHVREIRFSFLLSAEVLQCLFYMHNTHTHTHGVVKTTSHSTVLSLYSTHTNTHPSSTHLSPPSFLSEMANKPRARGGALAGSSVHGPHHCPGGRVSEHCYLSDCLCDKRI